MQLDAELDERGILFERGAEEHLARQEHHDEIGARMHVRGVALCGQLQEVRAHLARVIGQQCLAGASSGASRAFR